MVWLSAARHAVGVGFAKREGIRCFRMPSTTFGPLGRLAEAAIRASVCIRRHNRQLRPGLGCRASTKYKQYFDLRLPLSIFHPVPRRQREQRQCRGESQGFVVFREAHHPSGRAPPAGRSQGLPIRTNGTRHGAVK